MATMTINLAHARTPACAGAKNDCGGVGVSDAARTQPPRFLQIFESGV